MFDYDELFWGNLLALVVYVGAICWAIALFSNGPSVHWLVVLPIYAFFIVLACGLIAEIGKEFQGGCLLAFAIAIISYLAAISTASSLIALTAHFSPLALEEGPSLSTMDSSVPARDPRDLSGEAVLSRQSMVFGTHIITHIIDG